MGSAPWTLSWRWYLMVGLSSSGVILFLSLAMVLWWLRTRPPPPKQRATPVRLLQQQQQQQQGTPAYPHANGALEGTTPHHPSSANAEAPSFKGKETESHHESLELQDITSTPHVTTVEPAPATVNGAAAAAPADAADAPVAPQPKDVVGTPRVTPQQSPRATAPPQSPGRNSSADPAAERPGTTEGRQPSVSSSNRRSPQSQQQQQQQQQQAQDDCESTFSDMPPAQDGVEMAWLYESLPATARSGTRPAVTTNPLAAIAAEQSAPPLLLSNPSSLSMSTSANSTTVARPPRSVPPYPSYPLPGSV